jgi:two-component system, OmpR family, sensor histidine kinase ChvG
MTEKGGTQDRIAPCQAARKAVRSPGFSAVPDPPHLGSHVFSSLTSASCAEPGRSRRAGVGHPLLNQFRDGLIDARVESLMTQGEIIAGAIAASATVETDSIASIPKSCWNCRPDRACRRRPDRLDSLEFPINPERVAPVLRRLISPTRTARASMTAMPT